MAFTMCPHLCSQFYMPAIPKETWTHFPTLGASAPVCPGFLSLDQNLGNLEEPCVKYATCSWTSVHFGNMFFCESALLWNPCSVFSSRRHSSASKASPLLNAEQRAFCGPHYTHRQPFPEQSTSLRSFFSHELQSCVQFLLFWSLAFLPSTSYCTARLRSITQPPQTPPDLLLHCPTRALVCQTHLFLVFPTTQLLIDQTSFIPGNLYSL